MSTSMPLIARGLQRLRNLQTSQGRSRTAVSGLLALLAALSTGPALAIVQTEIGQSSRTIGLNSRDEVMNGHAWGPGTVRTDTALLETGAGYVSSGHSSATGHIRPGRAELRLDAGALTASSGPGALIFTDGYVHTYTRDSFIIDCPVCVAGTRGTLTLEIQAAATVTLAGGQLPGATGGHYGSYVNWYSNLGLTADGILDGDQPLTTWMLSGETHTFQDGVLDVTVQGRTPGLNALTVDFIFGQPVNFVWRVDAGFSSGAGTAEPHVGTTWSSTLIDITRNQLYWNGITSVLDSDGQAVTGFTAFSPERVNFARSFALVVPEPSTWLLMGLGLGLVGWCARRRRAPASLALPRP